MLSAFLVAFATILVAEMADKTQLASVALATRFRLSSMLAGVAIGSAAIMGISAAAGALAGAALPARAIGVAAGAVFVAAGTWMLVNALGKRRSDARDDGETAAAEGMPVPEEFEAHVTERRSGARPVLIVAGTFVLAELGDKTMLAAIMLASKGNPIAVWAGGAAALFVVDAIAAALGDVLSRVLPAKIVMPIAGGLFIAAGTWMLWDALAG